MLTLVLTSQFISSNTTKGSERLDISKSPYCSLALGATLHSLNRNLCHLLQIVDKKRGYRNSSSMKTNSHQTSSSFLFGKQQFLNTNYHGCGGASVGNQPDSFVVRDSVTIHDRSSTNNLAQTAEKQDIINDQNVHVERKKIELWAMKSSNTGRSVLLVQKVIQIVEPYRSAGIEPLGIDDAVFLAERFMQCQDQFQSDGKPTRVYVGFHYTDPENIDSIRGDGLLTIDDRIKYGNINNNNVAVFGDGVYTGGNPTAFEKYGDVGLIVAVLKGWTKKVTYRQSQPHQQHPGADTLVGNKTGDSPYDDEIILQRSEQVLPLLKYYTYKISDKGFKNLIWSIHKKLQQVLDEFCNDSKPTLISRENYERSLSIPTTIGLQGRYPAPIPQQRVPTVNQQQPLPRSLFPQWPPQVPANTVPQQTTTAFSFGPAPALKPQANQQKGFHPFVRNGGHQQIGSNTTSSSFTFGSQSNSAPTMRNISTIIGTSHGIIPLGHPFAVSCAQGIVARETISYNRATSSPFSSGTSPAGTMEIATARDDCQGFGNCGSIIITYRLKGGMQHAQHPNQGVSYSGATALAYLPNNADGKDILKRLKYTFRQGLTFTLGTNLTTNTPNSIVWRVEHKLSLYGGMYGWPDASYFADCNRKLDTMNVPWHVFL